MSEQNESNQQELLDIANQTKSGSVDGMNFSRRDVREAIELDKYKRETSAADSLNPFPNVTIARTRGRTSR